MSNVYSLNSVFVFFFIPVVVNSWSFMFCFILTLSAPKVTKGYKKNGAFKVTVKDKKTKKPVKGAKLKLMSILVKNIKLID